MAFTDSGRPECLAKRWAHQNRRSWPLAAIGQTPPTLAQGDQGLVRAGNPQGSGRRSRGIAAAASAVYR